MEISDKVLISPMAEECCAAEDGGEVGTIVDKRKLKKGGYRYTVKSKKGEWYHCGDCINLINDSGTAD